jgi:hypothetical protein
VERGYGALRGLRQRDRHFGTVSRHCRPGDGHKNIEPDSGRVSSINASCDGNRERASELGRAPRDLVMKGVTLRSRLATDQK